ncbi:MAG TPA: flagellar export chaperone FliS [Phycisphaerales bacterium]|nr:flagellar export chaperone FliS [Phycisphaerales bacterium]
MTTTEANAYLRTQVMTASPEQLRLMLLDGALRFARQAVEGIAGKDYEAAYNGITQARAIVLELATSIRADIEPELAERVRSVYLFIYKEMVDASLNRDTARLEKAIELLQYERETWALLIERVAAERAASRTPTPLAPATESTTTFTAQA